MNQILSDAALKTQMAGNRHFQSGCLGKVRYEDEREAVAARRVMKKKMHCKFDAYHCSFCGNWHVGHRTKQPR